jgi:hypothetical protein
MLKRWAVSIATVFLASCAGDTSLNGAFEKQMKDDGAGEYSVLHIEEGAKDGIVLFTAGGEAALFYFGKSGQGWARQTGTDCDASGISQVGLMGNGYVYCGTLRQDMDFMAIRVGGNDALLFDTPDGRRIWYARVDDMGLDVSGVMADGREVGLN